jgi:hypothetical protein
MRFVLKDRTRESLLSAPPGQNSSAPKDRRGNGPAFRAPRRLALAPPFVSSQNSPFVDLLLGHRLPRERERERDGTSGAARPIAPGRRVETAFRSYLQGYFVAPCDARF